MANNLNFYAAYCVTHKGEQTAVKIGETYQEGEFGLAPDFEYQINLNDADTTGDQFKDFVEFKYKAGDYDDADSTKNFESLSIIIKDELFKQQNDGYLRYLDTGNNNIPNDAEFIAKEEHKDRFSVEQKWHDIDDGMLHVGKQIMAVHNLGDNTNDLMIDISNTNDELFENLREENEFIDNDSNEGGIIKEYNQEDTNDTEGYNIAKNFIDQLIQHLININDTNDDHNLTSAETGSADNHTTIDLDDDNRKIKSITLYIKLKTELKLSIHDQKQEDDSHTSLIRIVLNKSSKDWDSTFQSETDA